MTTINLDNTSTSSSGNLIFSGISSGIDTQSTVDAIIAAKRINATQIEDNITLNNSKIDAFDQMKALTVNLTNSLDILRGNPNIFADDVFDTKLAFTESVVSAGAPADHTASVAAEVLGVSVTGSVVEGSHSVEVVQIARAQQIRSDAFASKSLDLVGDLGYPAGAFEINGKSVNITAGDTLLDLRDKINATNSGADASHVTASVVSVSDTEHYMVLTSSKTGEDNQLTFTGDQTIHNALGLTDSGTDTVKTEIQEAANSIIRVDNLGVDIERQTNTINDVLGGLTLNIFKAEEGTEIKIDIEPDRNSMKTAVVGFTEAYNELKAFIEDQQSQQIRGNDTSASFGELAFDSTLRQLEEKMNSLVSGSVAGLTGDYTSLGQIGITVEPDFSIAVNDETFDAALLSNLDDVRSLFTFDYSSSDSRVSVISVGNQTTYSVDGSGNVNAYYLNIAGTDGDKKVTGGNVSESAGAGTVSDGSITREGQLITVTDFTGAEGLQLFFAGGANEGPINDIEISFTRGIADRAFGIFDEFTKIGGTFDTVTDDLREQNTGWQADVEAIDTRLDIQRQSLNARFLAMETAITQLNALREQIAAQTEAFNAG